MIILFLSVTGALLQVSAADGATYSDTFDMARHSDRHFNWEVESFFLIGAICYQSWFCQSCLFLCSIQCLIEFVCFKFLTVSCKFFLMHHESKIRSKATHKQGIEAHNNKKKYFAEWQNIVISKFHFLNVNIVIESTFCRKATV